MAAPIALFAYRRLSHLKHTLKALRECVGFGDHPLYIFSDGPKNDAAAHDVARVRSFLSNQAGGNVTIVERAFNFGLANSIIAAVSDLCATHGSVIVVEDDLILHPEALRWFDAGLAKYEYDDRVWQIAAHQFAVPSLGQRRDGLFLRMTTSWGWATWRRAWNQFDSAAEGWEKLATDRSLRRAFNLNGAYNYAAMLERQMAGEVDSWAVRWWWTVFNQRGYTLCPPRSLVNNIGIDETATHVRFGRIRKLLGGAPCVFDRYSPIVPECFEYSDKDQARVEMAIRFRKLFDGRQRVASLLKRKA